MQYLAWRVMVGLNDNITMSFLIVGHTNFSPNWCFGLLKRAFRRTRVGCLDDIARVVENSANVNHAQLVGTQDGKTLVPTYNWAEYFDPFFKATAFKGIKAMHHMRFTRAEQGTAYVKDAVDLPERRLQLLKVHWNPKRDELPTEIPPPGLSLERRRYLFEKIRDFCPPHCQDAVCPEPPEDKAPAPPTPKRRKQ